MRRWGNAGKPWTSRGISLDVPGEQGSPTGGLQGREETCDGRWVFGWRGTGRVPESAA